MDPTSPEFRPRFQPESTRPDSESSQSTNHRPPATSSNDPQWRTKCRTCGEAFKSRNQLMRHLYRSHPLKPGKSKAPAKTAKASLPQPPSLPTPPHPSAPKSNQSPVHPFARLPHQEQVAFVGHAMRAIFAVGMKQREEEQAQQRGEDQRDGSAHSQTDTPALPTPNSSAPSASHAGTGPAPAAPDQTYQGKEGDDSGSEDSDEDGGAPLYGSAYGEFPGPLPPQHTEDELSWLDQIDDLD